MELISPGQARIRKFTIKGTDLTKFVRELSVYESLFKNHQSAEVMIMDTNNIMNNMRLQGNEPAELVFESGSGGIYEASLKVLSIANENSSQGLRAQGTKVNLVGQAFLANQTMRIQQSFQNITGTDAIRNIHNRLGLTDGSLSASPSRGFIGEREPYIVSNQRPHDAIQDIRTRLTHDRYRTGAYAYFRNNEGYILKPLEELFSTMNVRERFTHDATMGKSYLDVYRQARNIIGYQAGTSFSNGGRFSVADVLRTADAARVSSFNTLGASYQQGQRQTPPTGQVSGSAPNPAPASSQSDRTFTIFPHDPRLEQFSKMIEKMAGEQRYIQQVQNAFNCTIQVMLDAGINCTVGQAVDANIAQPIGDLASPFGSNFVGGTMMVVNLRHHIKMYDTNPRATTILELAKGGFNS